MPIENFKIYDTPEDTLRIWSRQLGYLFRNIDIQNINIPPLSISSTALTVDGSIKAVGRFGCNNATPRTSATVASALSTNIGGSSDLNVTNSLLNQIRTALINNGICV